MTKVAEWRPIAEFDFSAAYAGSPFLAWIVPPADCDLGENFQECWIEDGKFIGTWRYMCGEDKQPINNVNELEPVAFMLIGAPEFLGAAAQPLGDAA